ncbi:MAG: ComF family protein, partial [Anaerolineae bacterium]
LCHGCSVSSDRWVVIRSVGLYASPLSSAIQQLKYGGVMAIAEPLGQLLADYWQARVLAMDLVVPVPLHGRRLRERGFNQARLLATAFCYRAGLPLVHEGMLRRDRDTPQQVRLGPEERRHNVSGAFAWHGPPLAGARVVLSDDVVTTGATLAACAQALREAGARRVWALTVARAIS